MKRLAILASMFIVGCAGSVRPIQNNQGRKPHNEDHVITLNWSQSVANNGFCSSTVTSSCISGFNEGFMSGVAQNQLHNDNTSVCTGSTQTMSCTSTFNGILPIGSIVFYVVTTFVDQNGAAGVTTAALSPAVNVSADPAQNVTVTVK